MSRYRPDAPIFVDPDAQKPLGEKSSRGLVGQLIRTFATTADGYDQKRLSVLSQLFNTPDEELGALYQSLGGSPNETAETQKIQTILNKRYPSPDRKPL